MWREIIHSIILILAIAFSFLFAQTPFVKYDLQFAIALFVLLLIGKRFLKQSRVLEATVFTLIVFTIVNTSGGLESQFFFLVYFLLFALALLLEPIESMIATLTAIILFLVYFPTAYSISSLLPLLSMAILTPFAMFMGQAFVRNEQLKRQTAKNKEETFLFLSLLIKNHIKTINQAVENFMGDKQLSEIKKATRNMDKLIEKFEKGK